jgi:hypothetical protein
MLAILEYLITVVEAVLEYTAPQISMRHLRSQEEAAVLETVLPVSVEVLLAVPVPRSLVGQPTVVGVVHSLLQVLVDREIEAAVLPAVEGTAEQVPEPALYMPVEQAMAMVAKDSLEAVMEHRVVEVVDIGAVEVEVLPLVALLAVVVAAMLGA